MGMREECKHFQSRTYSSGEVARFCSLGNAPDQPWSCPADCITYERRLADVGWSHGSLARRPNVEPEPATEIPLQDRRDILSAADAIIDAVAPEMIAERRQEIDRRDAAKRGWKFWKRS